MNTTANKTDVGVLIAIDWENIRRGAQMYQQTVSPRALCDAVKRVGEVFGEVRGGKAFGDWNLRREDGTSFSMAGIEPARNALIVPSGHCPSLVGTDAGAGNGYPGGP